MYVHKVEKRRKMAVDALGSYRNDPMEIISQDLKQFCPKAERVLTEIKSSCNHMPKWRYRKIDKATLIKICEASWQVDVK